MSLLLYGASLAPEEAEDALLEHNLTENIGNNDFGSDNNVNDMMIWNGIHFGFYLGSRSRICFSETT